MGGGGGGEWGICDPIQVFQLICSGLSESDMLRVKWH